MNDKDRQIEDLERELANERASGGHVIGELKRDIESLNREVDRLTTENERLQEESDEMRYAIEHGGFELVPVPEGFTVMPKGPQVLVSVCDQLKGKLDRLEKENERLQEALQKATDSRDHYMAEFDRFDSGYWEVVRQRNELSEELDEQCRRELRKDSKIALLERAVAQRQSCCFTRASDDS